MIWSGNYSEESGLAIKYGWFEMTAFMWACNNGHKDVVQLLLDHLGRIDLNARVNNGWTALMIACQKGENNIVKLPLIYHMDMKLLQH